MTKYSKEALEKAVAQSKSVADVLRFFNTKISGSVTTHVARKIRQYEIDTSHFDGGRSKHLAHGKRVRLSAAEILVKQEPGKYPHAAEILRRALLEIGREERCVGCGLGTEWQGRFIRLQIDHKDGNTLNNAPENLRFLCPNCHAQTETHSKVKNYDAAKFMCECGRPKQARSKRCASCQLGY